MGVGKFTHKHFVTVHGKECEVETYQEFKTVWIASCAYEGQYISALGESEFGALRRWEEAACDKGNLGALKP